MRIATWNVNSVRPRLDRVLAFLERQQPDVLCLQEIKVLDADFPRDRFEALGWHVETFGQPTYNGVAFISREQASDVVRGLPDDGDDAQRRLIAGTFFGVRVVNIYVPNGQSPESDKFVYKLDWLERLEQMLAGAHGPGDDLVLLGDFNIAPDDRDVHDPDAWRGHVHFHPKEHEALAKLQALGLADLFRWHERAGGHYSWWDYRGQGYECDAGLRIDLVLVTESMAERSEACFIERAERAGEGASDHAPVIADFD
ncbi:MAG: exodeoxyribonuclease III [Planctomycetota bacterium]|nr:exodeoxyribonuclease III [Planctomycetota bacterium]